MNDGPDPVSIAQVQVDDAYWQFTAAPNDKLTHLGQTTLTIPYPWVEGEPHHIKVVTSTGTTFDYEITIALETPRPGLRYLGVFALIGLYVGVIPVAIGLLWFPMMSRLGRRGLDFALALTVGLLTFLVIDASAEGLEAAQALPGSYQGTTLLVMSSGAAYLTLTAVASWLKRRRAGTSASGDGCIACHRRFLPLISERGTYISWHSDSLKYLIPACLTGRRWAECGSKGSFAIISTSVDPIRSR